MKSQLDYQNINIIGLKQKERERDRDREEKDEVGDEVLKKQTKETRGLNFT